MFEKVRLPLSEIKAPKGLDFSYYKRKGLDEDTSIVMKLIRIIESGQELNPFVIDENNKIMDGLHRYVAYKKIYARRKDAFVEVFRRIK